MDTRYSGPIIALENKTPIRFGAPDFHRSIPKAPGIYVVVHHSPSGEEILYVGKAKNLQDRLYYNLLQGDDAAHTLSRKLISKRGLPNKAQVKRFLREACAVRFIGAPDPKERSFLEHYAIAHFRAPLND